MDSNLGLYIVSTNQKHGVVNKDGRIIIYPEYDVIGIDDVASYNTIKNQYILLDNYIPASKNKKWGWFNTTGKLIAPIGYAGLGCKNSYTTEITGDPVLTIPDYNAIVVRFNDKNDKTETNTNNPEESEKYLILNATGRRTINK